MRKRSVPYHLLLLTFLLGWAGLQSMAQSPFDAGQRDQAALIREQVQVFADRSIYAVGEAIHFYADHRVSGPVGSNPWSSVLYVELITPGGEALAQVKIRLSLGRAQGSLSIPASVLTGNYYLKCYTRWMRNWGPESFSYIPLKVINPFRSEVLGTVDRGSSSDSIQRLAYREGVLECSASSQLLKSGQEMVLHLKGAPNVYMDQLRCCVTVVPQGSIDLSGGQYLLPEYTARDSFKVSFLPDLGDGVSISGTVLDGDQVPLAYKTLHFSQLGENPDYFASMTDEQGRFVLSIPRGKEQMPEFFVTPEQEEVSKVEIRIDQEYDTRPLALPAEPFRLAEDESELATKIALNMQLSRAFAGLGLTESSTEKDYAEGERIPFYGTSVKRLLIDDYVRLPNLEEIFINLMPEVQFYRKQGKNRIRILSNNSSIEIYKPLIMIDHISVFDHEALLALSPEKIQRIDLIDDIYLKGNVAFGGVLSIHSRKGDMAGIDLPESSYFFDYHSIHPELPLREAPVPGSRVPDTRNTSYWTWDQVLNQGQQLDISFQAPGNSGSYVILVRAVSPDGEVYATSTSFKVE